MNLTGCFVYRLSRLRSATWKLRQDMGRADFWILGMQKGSFDFLNMLLIKIYSQAIAWYSKSQLKVNVHGLDINPR